MKHCKDCKFHAPIGKHEDGTEVGYCYRFPPAPIADGKSTLPPVNSNVGWCGEFKPAPRRARK